MYTTMEPCSRRLSGKTSCTQLLLSAGAEHVVIAAREPPTFIAHCTGAQDLEAAGVRVTFCERWSAQALELNRHVLPPAAPAAAPAEEQPASLAEMLVEIAT
jgi:pyrimidine deaminase RibD-like protein